MRTCVNESVLERWFVVSRSWYVFFRCVVQFVVVPHCNATQLLKAKYTTTYGGQNNESS